VKISFSTIAFILSIYPALAEPLPTFDTSAGAKYTGVPVASRAETYDNDEMGDVAGKCAAPGHGQYAVIRTDNGAGLTWQMTNDTRDCSQAGIDDPVFKVGGGD
jgi:hypothetical protein